MHSGNNIAKERVDQLAQSRCTTGTIIPKERIDQLAQSRGRAYLKR